MQVSPPFGPLNRCRNGGCGELVSRYSWFQHYCANCADSNLGLRAGQPALRITKALQLRQRFVGRLLHEHQAKFPPAVVKHILDFILNDLGKLAVSKRWACILLRSGVQLECVSFYRFIAPSGALCTRSSSSSVRSLHLFVQEVNTVASSFGLRP